MKQTFDLDTLKKQRVFTVAQAAFYSGTSRDVVLRWLHNGLLGYFVLPNTSSRKVQRRILREELEQFLESQYKKAKPRTSENNNQYTLKERPKLVLIPREKCDTASR
jgi:excisionase family DNA binding protein